MRLVNRSIKKRSANLKNKKNTFLFLKTINFTVNNINRYQLKSLKCPFIYKEEAIETFDYPIFNSAKFHSQWDLRLS